MSATLTESATEVGGEKASVGSEKYEAGRAEFPDLPTIRKMSGDDPVDDDGVEELEESKVPTPSAQLPTSASSSATPGEPTTSEATAPDSTEVTVHKGDTSDEKTDHKESKKPTISDEDKKLLSQLLQIYRIGRQRHQIPNGELDTRTGQKLPVTEEVIQKIRELDLKHANSTVLLTSVRVMLIYHQLLTLNHNRELTIQQTKVGLQKKTNAVLTCTTDEEKSAAEAEQKTAEAELAKIIQDYNKKIEDHEEAQRTDLVQCWDILDALTEKEDEAAQAAQADAKLALVTDKHDQALVATNAQLAAKAKVREQMRKNQAKSIAKLRLDVARLLRDMGRLQKALTELQTKPVSLEEELLIFKYSNHIGDYKTSIQLLPKIARTSLENTVNMDKQELRKIIERMAELQKAKVFLLNRLQERKKELEKYQKHKRLTPDVTRVKASLHQEAQQTAGVDYSVVFDLVKEHKLTNQTRDADSMKWTISRPVSFRVKFAGVKCPKGYEDKQKQLLKELQKSPTWNEWESLPLLEGLVLREMGGITQVLNYSDEERISLVGPTLPGRMHVRGSTDVLMEREPPPKQKDAKPKSKKETERLMMMQRIPYFYDPEKVALMTQSEEWDLVQSKDNPRLYTGRLVHVEAPKEMVGMNGRGGSPNSDDIPITQEYDCELLLGTPQVFEASNFEEGVETGIDGLDLC